MSENPGDHRGLYSSGDDLHGATDSMAVFSRVRNFAGLKWQLNYPEEL
jgi:predicted heme/steroid binding protein